MDLLDSFRILVRRWWLTVPLLVITLGGVVAGAAIFPWTYKSEATVVLLSSRLQAKQTGGNPWLAFDSSLTVTAEVVGREIMDGRTVDALRKQGNTAQYKVGLAADSTGPVLVVEVEGPEPQVTQNTLNAVLRLIPARLDDIQNQGSVAPQARIKPATVSASPQPTRVVKDKIRTLLMMLFAGLVVTIGVPLFAESLAVRRRYGPASDDYPSPPRPAAGHPAASLAGTNGSHRTVPVEEEWTPYLPPDPVTRAKTPKPVPGDPRRTGS
jgi:capsular polysaccharide biosynthesis protein